MSTAVLTFTPEFGLQEDVEFLTLVFQADSGKEKRRAKWSRPIRTISCSLNNQSESGIGLMWDFFKARQGKYDSFWVKFPTSYKVMGEAVGIGNGVQTVFPLDYYPVDIASVKVYVNGVLRTAGVTIANDLTNEVAKATITSAPANGATVTADYEYYIQVRFDDDKLSKELVQFKLYNTGLKLKEVLWNIYTAP